MQIWGAFKKFWA